jgi:hypothetical protein
MREIWPSSQQSSAPLRQLRTFRGGKSLILVAAARTPDRRAPGKRRANRRDDIAVETFDRAAENEAYSVMNIDARAVTTGGAADRESRPIEGGRGDALVGKLAGSRIVTGWRHASSGHKAVAAVTVAC